MQTLGGWGSKKQSLVGILLLTSRHINKIQGHNQEQPLSNTFPLLSYPTIPLLTLFPQSAVFTSTHPIPASLCPIPPWSIWTDSWPQLPMASCKRSLSFILSSLESTPVTYTTSPLPQSPDSALKVPKIWSGSPKLFTVERGWMGRTQQLSSTKFSSGEEGRKSWQYSYVWRIADFFTLLTKYAKKR